MSDMIPIETILKASNLSSKIKFARDRMLPEVFPDITPSFNIKPGDIERCNDEIPSFVERDDIYQFTGKAGSALLVNTTHCLHKAGLPKNGLSRDLLELRFNVSDKACALEWPIQKKWESY